MPEPLRPLPFAPRPDSKERLESWKEIAAYLGREVRTVQGWEKNEGLPVHRHQHARQGSVYALKPELDAWREARKGTPPEPEPPAATGQGPAPPAAGRRSKFLIAVLCAVVILAAAGLIWIVRQPPSPGTSLSSIVVLPFLDLSPQKDQDYFSDGLTEEIIDGLSRVPNLRVVARTSAFAFKGKAVDIRQIGQQLNVAAVLEGSVRKAGDQLRITAQLNRASDGTHLWSRTYDRQLRDIFAVQREISQSIADQLRAGQVPPRAPASNLEAYRLYQEGRYLFNQHQGPASYLKAIERYQQAIQRDPKFALAYSGLADAHSDLTEGFAAAPREVMPKAKEAAEKAVALDDTLGEAHTSLGIVKLDYEWDREAAQSEFRKAMQLNPGSGYVRHWFAHSLEAQGRLDEALKEMRASLALDPLSMPIYWDIAFELYWAGKYDEALVHLNKAFKLFPDQPIMLVIQAEVYYDKGDIASAHRAMEKMKAVFGGEIDKVPVFVAFIGWAAAKEGRTAEARKALADLDRISKTQYVEPLMVTWLCSALGDRNSLLTWFQRGYEERSSQFVYAPLYKDRYGGIPEIQALFAKAIR